MELKGDRKQGQRCVLLHVAYNTGYELDITYMRLLGALSALEKGKGKDKTECI